MPVKTEFTELFPGFRCFNLTWNCVLYRNRTKVHNFLYSLYDSEQNTGAVDFENVLIRNLIYMWLRNTSMSERTQENELFTSYVPGLQDVGSYGNHASVSFFLHRLGKNSYSSIRAGEMIEAASQRETVWNTNTETPVQVCRWEQLSPGVQERGWAAEPPAATPSSQTWRILDEGKLIYKSEYSFSISLHSFCSPLQVSEAGYSSLLVHHV